MVVAWLGLFELCLIFRYAGLVLKGLFVTGWLVDTGFMAFRFARGVHSFGDLVWVMEAVVLLFVLCILFALREFV